MSGRRGRASVPPEPSCLPELIAAPALLPGQLHRKEKPR
jgi:hypothetical protein